MVRIVSQNPQGKEGEQAKPNLGFASIWKSSFSSSLSPTCHHIHIVMKSFN